MTSVRANKIGGTGQPMRNVKLIAGITAALLVIALASVSAWRESAVQIVRAHVPGQ